MIDLKAIRAAANFSDKRCGRLELDTSTVIVLLDRLEAAEKALAEPAVEPVGYVRMLNGEPTPDDDGCVFSYGENPYRDTYGDEEWVPVSVASPPSPAEVPLLDNMNILRMWHETSSRVPWCNHYNHFARAIEQAVRQEAGL